MTHHATTNPATGRLQTFNLPDVGEGLTEAEILSWHVAEGDLLEVNQIMVEIETAKAAVELPSPFAGRVHRLLAEPGVTIDVGTPIIQIDTQPDAGPLEVDDGDGAGGAAAVGATGGAGAGGGAAGAAAGSGRPGAAGPGASGASAAGGVAASGVTPDDSGAKIGEATADGRVATLVGYIAAESGGARRPRRTTAGAGQPSAAPASGSARPERASTEPAAAYGGARLERASAEPAPASGSARLERASAEPAPASGSARPQRASTEVAREESVAASRPAPESASGQAATALAPLATPPVRKLAKDLGVDLRTVAATRADGVISRSDVEAAYAAAESGSQTGAELSPSAASPEPAGTTGSAAREAGRVIAYDPATRETRVPVKGVRKMTAAAMVSSAFTAPHVTEFLSVDVTPMMKLRDKLRARPEFANVRLSPLAFAARAVCLAARRTPEANSVWVDGPDGGGAEILYKQYVHLGIAAATPRGLIVPVIRDADQLDLLGLAQALADLTATARAGRTAPADMTGATIAITNVGVLGVDSGTPIINPGSSVILALGSIKDAPWVVDGKLKVRKVCQLALSFDHRLVDGEQGSHFLADIGALLADPGLAITY